MKPCISLMSSCIYCILTRLRLYSTVKDGWKTLAKSIMYYQSTKVQRDSYNFNVFSEVAVLYPCGTICINLNYGKRALNLGSTLQHPLLLQPYFVPYTRVIDLLSGLFVFGFVVYLLQSTLFNIIPNSNIRYVK